MRRLAAIVATTIAAASVLLLAAIAVGPRTGMYRTLTVLTGSMEPGLGVGSLIVVTPKPVDELRAGDVITFEAPDDGRVVTHRVVELGWQDGKRTFISKGDANAAPDPWTAVIEDTTVWETRLAVPGVGSALIALQDPTAKRLTLWVVPFLLALIYLKDIWSSQPCEP